jgi:hypothetical protein
MSVPLSAKALLGRLEHSIVIACIFDATHFSAGKVWWQGQKALHPAR